MAVANNDTRRHKLSLSSCGTPSMIQALMILSVLRLAASAAMVAVQPPSSSGSGGCRHYRFELTHVDANLSLSSDELMRRAYERTTTTILSSPDSDDSHHPGYLSVRDATYIIEFYIGDREDRIRAVVDTGSDLIWTTKAECSLSTTKSELPCCSPKCKQRANCGTCSSTDATNRSSSRTSSSFVAAQDDETTTTAAACRYDITYGGDAKKKTKGVLYEDKLTFVSKQAVPPSFRSFEKIAIGCSTAATLGFKDPSIKGIVGLGRAAKQSLPGQLSFDKFSYCLSSYYQPKLPSYLLLTDAPDMAAGARSGAAVATTGLRLNDRYKSRYFVDLQGISIIGGGTMTGLDVAVTKSGGGGNMFVDTGASFSQLEESVFKNLVEKLDEVFVRDMQYSKQQDKNGRICYSPPSTTKTNPSSIVLPQMVLHFADAADMVLPSDSYLWKTKESKLLCLAMEISKIKGVSVLGNFQMQDIHMLFDTKNDKLAFVPADCSKV